MHFFRVRKLVQNAVDPLDDSGNVVGMIEEMVDHLNRDPGLIEAIPFLEAAAGRGERIVRIKRKQHQLVERGAFQRLDRLFGVRMPIAHRHDRARRYVDSQSSLERLRLPLGQPPDRRATADFSVMLAHTLRASGGYQLGQRLSALEMNRGN